MAEQKEFIGLNWVKTDVLQSLKEVRGLLEGYLESSPGQPEALSVCLARFNQIQSALKLLPQKSASLLAEELLGVTQALLESKTTNAQLAAETLLQSTLQLTTYVGQLAESQRDQPVVLMGVTNALRASRQLPSLTALDFFHPQVQSILPPLEAQQFEQLIQSGAIKLLKKIRQKYQVCLTSYLRRQETEKSLLLISKLFGKLQNLSWGSPSSVLWDAGAALIEGLSEGSIPPSEISNTLLKALDNQLKTLIDSEGADINKPPGAVLLKKLLFLIAIADSSSTLIQMQQKRYHLADALTDDLMQLINNELVQSPKKEIPTGQVSNPSTFGAIHKIAVLEARTELAHARKAIKDYRNTQRNAEYLSKLPVLLKSAWDTLNMASLTGSADLIRQLQGYIAAHWLREEQKPAVKAMDTVAKGLMCLESHFTALLQSDMKQAREHLAEAEQYLDHIEEKAQALQPVSLAEMSIDDLEIIDAYTPAQTETPAELPENTLLATPGTLSLATEEALSPETSSSIVEVKHRQTPLSSAPCESTESTESAESQDSEQDSESHDEDEKDEKDEKDEEKDEKSALVTVFTEAATNVQRELNTKFLLWEKEPAVNDAIKVIRRSFNTLKNSARASGANIIGELASAVENMLNRLLSGSIKSGKNMLTLLRGVIDILPELTDDFRADSQLLTPEVLLFMEQADDLARGETFYDPDELDDEGIESTDSPSPASEQLPDAAGQTIQTLTDLLLTPETDILLHADHHIEQWSSAIAATELKQFQQALQVLSLKAGQAKLEPLVLLCNVLMDVCHYLGLHEKSLPAILEAPLKEGFESLIDLLNQAVARQTIEPPQAIFSLIKQSLESLLKEKHARKNTAVPAKNNNVVKERMTPVIGEPDKTENLSSKPDLELVTLFLEEASDLTETCSQALQSWLRHNNSVRPVAELQRCLHTLKGGALMLEFHELGNLSHALESVYEAIVTGVRESDDAPLGLLQQAHDQIDGILQAISKGQAIPSVQTLVRQLNSWHGHKGRSGAVLSLPDYMGRASKVSPDNNHNVSGTTCTADRKAASEVPAQPVIAPSFLNDRVRVSSDLLEQLVNLAGESSIHRSQIDQQIVDMNQSLGEMDRTVQRLQEQLRRLDIETQTHILSKKHQGDTEANHDFDPLEMDRYSELAQLSNALVESASDLDDLHQSLQDKSRATETLLLQQSRTQSELQTHLTQIRLVPFKRLLPRLYKTVRQVSSDLSRPVDLVASNTDTKIDRTTLDKIQAPIEHILRNAIAHGIESDRHTRLSAGKSEVGQLHLSLSYQGTYIALEISDDGQGIDYGAIRQKALQKGLITNDEKPSQGKLLKLIMTSGFSTADEITQISGRGVGLDVVHNEVRQLGGHLQIESKPGKGTRFTLHLPFQSAISRALMVEQGGHYYAFPMQCIDGVVMTTPEELMASYIEGQPFEHAGVGHKVISFGQLLGLPPTRIQPEQCPVILIQRNGENVALHVDTVHGGREVITKSLGAQFKGLTGINGATILGEGHIVIIIDPVEMIRKHHERLYTRQGQFIPETVKVSQAVRVLIVDDSITMRKVTSEMLMRHGYQVETARNGIEAMNHITDHCPDLVLLDVEMPKMDGFEVASAIRNDPQFRALPIIMITSRTGAKHHARAKALSVNHYIGKPFQESTLLIAIKKLTSTVELESCL